MPIERSDRIIVNREFVAKTTEDIFLKYRAELIQDLRDSLASHGKTEPGELLKSIDVNVNINGTTVSMEVSMNDYWKFVDEGVDGTKHSYGSPFKFKKKNIKSGVLNGFIAARGININAKKVKGTNKQHTKELKQISREKALKQVSFLMGRKIAMYGIKPTHFFSDVINKDLKERLKQDLTIALKRDIEIDIKASFE